jgi:hypothetical protein
MPCDPSRRANPASASERAERTTCAGSPEGAVTLRSLTEAPEVVMWLLVLLAALLAYIGTRLGLTAAAIRADKAGNPERAEQLRARASRLFLGTYAVWTFGLCLVAIIVVATR